MYDLYPLVYRKYINSDKPQNILKNKSALIIQKSWRKYNILKKLKIEKDKKRYCSWYLF